ncbi:MAG TPA: lipid-binding SYLF domain-containing protein [Terriglobales bacterium]|nr:lipid-binding SYLF domain-containing protein [Terriglobales bacterium]
MKRIGILLALLMFCAFSMWAQDNSSTTSQRDTHKAAAQNDENAADQKKADAKEAGTASSAERDKVLARLDSSSKVLNELLGAPDNGIPEDVLKNAKCVAVVPSLAKGGFIFGAEHGRGVATCRTAHGWSAPAFFVVTGGSWGAQIGGEAVDLVMLIMNDNGMNELLSAKFKLGGTGSVAAGPVGRDASANTDWKLKSEVLTYSRTRGLFAGLTLNGAVIKQDDDATRAFYGRMEGFRPTLTGQVQAPPEAQRFLATVRHGKTEATERGGTQ